jgi:hypothetical protein
MLMAQAQKEKVEGKTEGNEVEVEKYLWGFRVSLKGTEKSWLIKQHNMKPMLVVVDVEVNRKVVDTKVIHYFNLDVTDICRLFMLSALYPELVVERLNGERVRVSKVTIIDYTEDHRPGFEKCSFYDDLMPKLEDWVDSD